MGGAESEEFPGVSTRTDRLSGLYHPTTLLFLKIFFDRNRAADAADAAAAATDAAAADVDVDIKVWKYNQQQLNSRVVLVY